MAETSRASDQMSQIDANALGQLSSSAEGRLALLDLLAALAAHRHALELERDGDTKAANRRDAEAEKLFGFAASTPESGRYIRRIITGELPSTLPALDLTERRVRRALAEATVSLDPTLRRPLERLRAALSETGEARQRDQLAAVMPDTDEQVRELIERVTGDIDADREIAAKRIDLFLGPPLP